MCLREGNHSKNIANTSYRLFWWFLDNAVLCHWSHKAYVSSPQRKVSLSPPDTWFKQDDKEQLSNSHVCVDPSTSVKPWRMEKSAETGSDVAPELRFRLIIHPGFQRFIVFINWGAVGNGPKLDLARLWLRPDQKITKRHKWNNSNLLKKVMETFDISTD